MKSESCRMIDPQGNLKRFMVEYRREHGTASHNCYYYASFDDAMRKYMHHVIDQTIDGDPAAIVRLREWNGFHEGYFTRYESRVFHPFALMDTEERHSSEKGAARFIPRLDY